MKNMNDKTKKRILLLGGIAVSVVLITLIIGSFKSPPIEDVDIDENAGGSQSVVVTPPNNTEKEDIKVPSIEPPKEDADAIGKEQAIQPDIEKKPDYTEDELKNPEQKPNGEKVDPPTKENPNPPQTEDKPVSKPTNPSGGLPGFNDVPNAGENQGSVVGSDGDINKQVGTMD